MPFELDIGAKIRARRLSNRQTLKQLAEKTGCSSAYLSQIENGKVSPSIASLKRIADALQAKITDLFLEAVPDEPVVVSADQRVLISLERWNAEIWSMVADPKNKRMHPFYTIIQPGGGSHGSYAHVGEEFGIVLKGQLEIDLDGVVHLVNENESFYYTSSQPHNWTNPGSGETVVVWVISPPTF
jgi:transcriptional regulator with XRE-family HTH domain